MRGILRRALLFGLVVVASACGAGSSPTNPSPSAPAASVTPSRVPPVTSFPPLTGSFRTFTFDRELTYQVSDYTKHSQLLLYDTGGFVLQYVSLHGEYRGGYTNRTE